MGLKMAKHNLTRGFNKRIVIPNDEELTILVVQNFNNPRGLGFATQRDNHEGKWIFIDHNHGDKSRYKHERVKHEVGDLILAKVEQREQGPYASYYRPYHEKQSSA